ncbi:MAG: nuclear transport factor 2 family protein [Ktedonobacterales bacterium]
MPRVLLVEDDADIRQALVFLLQDEGYQTREASTQKDALALVDTTTFDLVITDLLTHDRKRPLASAMMLREYANPTPVAILSAWPTVLESPGAADFAFIMSKPFDLDMLLTSIAGALQRHRSLSPEEEQRAQVVRQYFAALSACDWNALTGLCSDDVIYVLPGNDPLSATVEGKAAFRAYTESVFAHFPAARFEQVSVYATPGGLAARYQARWLDDGPTEQLQSGAVVFQFTGRKIKQIGIHLATDQLRRLLDTSLYSTGEE